MNNTPKTPAAANGPLLVGPGKSSRLQEMRNRAMANNMPPAATQPQKNGNANLDGISPELALARQLIDQRLAEIMSTLPAGKQKSLFKIRFGIELDQIKHLPIKRVAALLKIQQPQLTNPRGDMKQTVELTYNGEQS